MSNLEKFIAMPNVKDVTEEVFINDRIGKIKIKPMTNEQYNSYLARCRGKITKNGIDFKDGKYNLLVITNHVVDPDFNNAEGLAKAGFNDPYEFINAKLKAGEIQDIVIKIAELSGIGGSIDEAVEEAKN